MLISGMLSRCHNLMDIQKLAGEKSKILQRQRSHDIDEWGESSKVI